MNISLIAGRLSSKEYANQQPSADLAKVQRPSREGVRSERSGKARHPERVKIWSHLAGNRKQPERAVQEILDIKDVSNIKAILKSGFSCTEIAALYGVQKSAISKIKVGRTWKHVA